MNANDLILALDWCDRQRISATLLSKTLTEGRPDMMALLCRRLVRTLQQLREIESKARQTPHGGRGSARVPEAQSAALFLAARMSQRCTERGIVSPAEIAALIDACRGDAIPTPKGTKAAVKWNRAVHYVAANENASLEEIRKAVGVRSKQTISNWMRLPEFGRAVEMVKNHADAPGFTRVTAKNWRKAERVIRKYFSP